MAAFIAQGMREYDALTPEQKAAAVHGWLAGRAARLQRGKLLVATSIAAGLGLVMILLKDLVLIHLH